MNENTSKGEEAKVGLGNEVTGIISNREKDHVKNIGISNDFRRLMGICLIALKEIKKQKHVCKFFL